ncbi:hypothetical protein A0256_22855 [Mucilaginibacter sp. PAMC 26640]|nr:hypothetical protein A0256_22855 [Mucilaginibacter sp. PAMC 26640]
MKFDFYLSEMSVSDKHGGGLTLQRILGEDLNSISHFIHVNRFAADLPAKGDFLARSTDLLAFWETDLVRKVIGRSLSARLGKTLLLMKMQAGAAAKKISKLFEGRQELTCLVCPQGANAILTLEALMKLRKVSYVTWMMDDHLAGYNGTEWQYPPGMELTFAKHLANARQVFVISPAMQQFYKDRFGIASTVLFGSSAMADAKVTGVKKNAGVLRIGYFGAVAAWQIDALSAFARALNGTATQLDIYTGIDRLPAELVTDNIHFKGSLPPSQVLAMMQSYDAVLLPVSFQQNMRNMSQFNIATKMSEYLASGVPILAVGPAYSAMITYLERNKAAITVPSDKEDDIRGAFTALHNPQLIATILQNAQKLVQQQVGANPMRSIWQAAMNALPEFN